MWLLCGLMCISVYRLLMLNDVWIRFYVIIIVLLLWLLSCLMMMLLFVKCLMCNECMFLLIMLVWLSFVMKCEKLVKLLIMCYVLCVGMLRLVELDRIGVCGV